jgi:hypothetical protein
MARLPLQQRLAVDFGLCQRALRIVVKPTFGYALKQILYAPSLDLHHGEQARQFGKDLIILDHFSDRAPRPIVGVFDFLSIGSGKTFHGKGSRGDILIKMIGGRKALREIATLRLSTNEALRLLGIAVHRL